MRVLIDCDTGTGVPGANVDDGLELALALRSPEVELVAVTVVAGNVPLPLGVASTRRILDLGGRSDIPVYGGAARPLLQDPSAIRERLAERARVSPGRELWRDVVAPAAAEASGQGHAALAMVREVMAHPGQTTIVATAPLTNLALALVLEPRVAANVRRVVIMGGAIALAGTRGDLNLGYDPEAARIVLRSGAPLLLVPLDVTTRTLFTLRDNARLAAARDPLARYLALTTEPWIRWSMQVRCLDGCWLHDPLAFAAALDPSLVTTRPMHLDVELSGAHGRGATIAVAADQRGQALHAPPSGEPNAQVAMDVEVERFTDLFLGRLLGGSG